MSQKDCEGNKRAAEFNDALLNVPGYADDTLLFIVRYGSLVKNTLRKADYEEFLSRHFTMNEHWSKSQGGSGNGGSSKTDGPMDPADPRDARAVELKAQTLEKIKDFPRLVRDFDKFTACTRAASEKYK